MSCVSYELKANFNVVTQLPKKNILFLSRSTCKRDHAFESLMNFIHGVHVGEILLEFVLVCVGVIYDLLYYLPVKCSRT